MLRKAVVAFIACTAFFLAFSAYSRRQGVAEVQLPAVTHRVYLDVEIDGQHIGRIVIGLYGEVVPKTVGILIILLFFQHVLLLILIFEVCVLLCTPGASCASVLDS
uniref:Uncharacterized protein n=1 Tax=Zea mays TaxID=4577 RepID=B8A0G5_MAIZE|nr:unknown [Zea mays]